jgi:DNA helicase II / ATP-dependent DNA helicase PcrA
MINKTEKEEKEYLENLLRQVDVAISFINEKIQSQSDEIKYLNDHLNEHKRDMDHLEKNAMREAVTNTAALGDFSVEKKKRLLRLRNVPYFGRIDFTKNGKTKPEPVYVGVHNFRDFDKSKNLVYD